MIGKSVHNQRIESYWAQLRKLVTGFYIDLFKLMQHKGVLNSAIPGHIECLRICFGPLIQHDLNMVRKLWNDHKIYKQPKKNIPGGIPNLLFKLPEKYNATDCKKPVPSEHINILFEKWTTEPILYNQRFKDVVVNYILPDFKVPGTAEEAYKSYITLIEQINKDMGY